MTPTRAQLHGLLRHLAEREVVGGPIEDAGVMLLAKLSRKPGYWDDVILARAAEIVGSYSTVVTLRQLHYRLVSDPAFDYSNTTPTTSSCRAGPRSFAGTVRSRALADLTRGIERVSWNETRGGGTGGARQVPPRPLPWAGSAPVHRGREGHAHPQMHSWVGARRSPSPPFAATRPRRWTRPSSGSERAGSGCSPPLHR